MFFRILLLAVLALVVACEEDGTTDPGTTPDLCYDGGCTTEDLPFGNAAMSPVVTDVTLECQSTSIVVLATVTDAQGTPNLLGVDQTVGVFPDRDCAETPIELVDDLAGSGLEESFGDAVLASEDQELYDLICSCEAWPVQVEFRDDDGNTTTGIVLAPVTD